MNQLYGIERRLMNQNLSKGWISEILQPRFQKQSKVSEIRVLRIIDE